MPPRKPKPRPKTARSTRKPWPKSSGGSAIASASRGSEQKIAALIEELNVGNNRNWFSWLSADQQTEMLAIRTAFRERQIRSSVSKIYAFCCERFELTICRDAFNRWLYAK